MGSFFSSIFSRIRGRYSLGLGDETDGVSPDQKVVVDEFYPFLSDIDTISHISRSHIMFIMRGLPGCGKSTVVKRLIEYYPSCVVCSADNFFYNDAGVYCHDVKKLGEAHESCQTKATEAASNRVRHIVIDNTNIRCWEMKHYLGLASQSGYIVVMVLPCTPWAFDPMVLERKNVHDVPYDVIQKKIETFEEVFPIFWGWFLNVDNSRQLLEMADKCFGECIHVVPDLQNVLRTYLKVPEESELLFGDHYRLRGAVKILHCTAFFAGYKNRSDAVHEYAHSEAVTQSMGKCFVLTITGIVITRDTVSARVQLTSEQLALFCRDLQDGPPRLTSKLTVEQTANNAVSEIPKVNKRDWSTVSQDANDTEAPEEKRRIGSDSVDAGAPEISSVQGGNSENGGHMMDKIPLMEMQETNQAISNVAVSTDVSPDGPKLTEVIVQNPADQKAFPVNNLPQGSRAHLTLGCSKDTQAVKAGEDMLDTLACESESHYAATPVNIDLGRVCYYGEGRCAIWFHQPVHCMALFTGKY